MYDIYGIKLADRDDVEVSFSLVCTDVGRPMKVSYYIWCIMDADRVFIVDTGMNEKEIKKRNLYNVASQVARLRSIGIEPSKIKDVIITHVHDDHFSAFGLFPEAIFYIQRREIEFFSGNQVKNQDMLFVNYMADIVKLNNAGQIQVLDGDEEIAPGLSVALVGGHTPGCQAVVVDTSEGKVVLGSDACPLYKNLEENAPSELNTNLEEAYAALEKLNKLASSGALIIPSHDQTIPEKFREVAEGVFKITSRNDL